MEQERPDVAPLVRAALDSLNKVLTGLDIPPVNMGVNHLGALTTPEGAETNVGRAHARLFAVMNPVDRAIGVSAWAVFGEVITAAGAPRVNMFVIKTLVQALDSLGNMGARLISADQAREMMRAVAARGKHAQN
ncbi:hypothetical protein [Nonomuraea maritima]|uniref:hypothetical protein n=1 Tax=Nonomuraea maritima TaxID=683260 RepID=UPI0037231C0D